MRAVVLFVPFPLKKMLRLCFKLLRSFLRQREKNAAHLEMQKIFPQLFYRLESYGALEEK